MGCASNKKNTGGSFCVDFTQVTGIVFVPPTASIAVDPVTKNVTLATVKANLYLPKTQRWYPLQNIMQAENASEEMITEDFPTGIDFVREGKRAMKLTFKSTLEKTKIYRSFNSNEAYCYLIDADNHIVGVSGDSNALLPFELDFVHTGKIGLNDGSASSKSIMYVNFADPIQLDDYGMAVKPSWSPKKELKGLVDVVLTVVGTPTATSIKVQVDTKKTNQIQGGDAILGLVVGDFKLLTTAGVGQTITSADDADDTGLYTLTGTGWTTGTLNLQNPTDAITKGYESTGSATITIV